MNMTKKKALNIAKRLYEKHVKVRDIKRYNYVYVTMLPSLCFNIKNKSLRKEWSLYWSTINNRKYSFMTCYFKHDYSKEEATLLRLLVLHQFINEHY